MAQELLLSAKARHPAHEPSIQFVYEKQIALLLHSGYKGPFSLNIHFKERTQEPGQLASHTAYGSEQDSCIIRDGGTQSNRLTAFQKSIGHRAPHRLPL
jgi:hypothetical protein